jgi:hypothetical protein
MRSSATAAALNRIEREMEAVVAAIPDAAPDELLTFLEALERLDTAYSWLLDHVPRGHPI